MNVRITGIGLLLLHAPIPVALVTQLLRANRYMEDGLLTVTVFMAYLAVV